MLLAFLKIFAKLPLPVLHIVGKSIGTVIYWFPGRYRIRIDRNLRQAGYPSKGMGRRASAQTGAMIMETPKVWLNHQSCLRKISSPDEAVVQAARQTGKGILYLTPQLGSFEITARYIAQSTPITVMYRAPRRTPLAPGMARARDIPGLRAVPANLQGVREFVRALRKGQAVGMLPDQVPRGGEGIWTPFFERPAYTMTLAAKLALQTQVAVVLTAGER